MIVYNVARRFFAMKADAENHRKELGLPPAALHKLAITDRSELAEFLDGLCALEKSSVEPATPEKAVANGTIVYDEIPDFVPKFLADAIRKRRGEG